MKRNYVMPKIYGQLYPGSSESRGYRPKYFAHESTWSAVDYGDDPIMLVCSDLSEVDHALLISQPDVISLPNLDDRFTTPRFNALLNWCENNGIPSDKFNANMTCAEILRTMIRIWKFHQRMKGIGVDGLFRNGRNQERLIGSLSAKLREDIQAAIVSFNWDSNYLNDNLSIRDVLKQVADFSQGRTYFGGEAI
jgi:hypothetical protein